MKSNELTPARLGELRREILGDVGRFAQWSDSEARTALRLIKIASDDAAVSLSAKTIADAKRRLAKMLTERGAP